MKAKHHRVAGGLVLNARQQALVLVRDVKRDGKPVHEVRLPKGHIDPGETEEEAARREVGEESGYHHVKIVSDLGVVHSRYAFKKVLYERDEHYFLMILTDPERGAPLPSGPEEALFEVHWVSLQQAMKTLSYPSEQEVARRGAQVLARDRGLG